MRLRLVLARHFQYSRDGLGVILEQVSNIIGDMLVDENDADVVAIRKIVKSVLDHRELGIALHDQKVRLVRGAMPHAGEQKPRHCILVPCTNITEPLADEDPPITATSLPSSAIFDDTPTRKGFQADDTCVFFAEAEITARDCELRTLC